MADAPPGVRDEVAAVAGRYRLALGRGRFRGRLGARYGHGVGGSLEFHDCRDYAPGDDLRHIDWRGYARSEQLRVRLHQAEVAPYVDIVLDGSASMASTARKAHAARLLTAAWQHWSQREGAAARVLALGGGRLSAAPEALVFAEPVDVPRAPTVPLRPGAVRVLVTDGLWAAAPGPLLQQLAAGAAQFVCLQLLDPWELAPEPAGALTLVDVETGARAEVQFDARAIAAYRQRLQRLVEALRGAVVARAGVFVTVAAAGLAEMAAQALLPAGVLEPA